MKTRYPYKEHVIECRAYSLRGGGWTAHVCVERHLGFGVLDNHVETGQTFPTQDAALAGALRIGMGKVETGLDAPTSGRTL